MLRDRGFNAQCREEKDFLQNHVNGIKSRLGLRYTPGLTEKNVE